MSKLLNLDRDQLALDLEFWTTDDWAIEAILRCEIMTRIVVDPCCGDGRFAEHLNSAGYEVYQSDIHAWPLRDVPRVGIERGVCADFLTATSDSDVARALKGATLMANAPFSKACEFVDHARWFGARKIVVFQRQAWREAQCRRAWWAANPPNRIYVCGDRAHTHVGTIPEEELNGASRFMPAAWYVWENGQPPGTLESVIWKDGA